LLIAYASENEPVSRQSQLAQDWNSNRQKNDFMEILETKVLRGPNYWSNYRKQLIALKVDIGELENLPTDKIPGFSERIEKWMPSLYEHHCSEGEAGGFFKRVKKGTWAGHVMEHIALGIQTLAGMECGYGRTRSAGPKGVYHVVFAYTIEQAGLYAAEAALRITEALIEGKEYDIDADVEELKRLKRKYSFGPSTQSIVDEAKRKNIPYKRLGNDSLVVLGHGHKQRKIRATIACSTSNIGLELASNKNETKRMLNAAFVPVPSGVLLYGEEEIEEALQEIRFPVVVKPVDGNHGRGITTNISTKEEVYAAFKIAKTVSDRIIIEEFVEGSDYRFLVVNYKLVAAARRTPAMITGDGTSTIEELISKENEHPMRGDGHENLMSRIEVDEVTQHILARNKYTLSTVLESGKSLFLKDTANLSSGGTATDVTDKVHPATRAVMERAARILNLNICGIDLVAKNIHEPLTRDIGAIVEVNACPGLRMHLSPSKGLGRNVAEPIIDMLFPNNDNGRIPLVAVTGTNGKTTTTRLVAHIASHMGHRVGFTTTDGIYINGHAVHYGDCTGPVSAGAVLTDPTIDFAVLESARGGILRSGLGFDTCDISIVTNVTEDHLGLKDIHTLEEMAKVKSVVPKCTDYDGYAILNADDDLVYGMKDELSCNVALFSMDAENPRIAEHCEDGGYAAVIENGYVTVCKGKWKIRIEKVDQIPLSLGGRAVSMVKNILPAVLTAVLRKFDPAKIREALHTFIPSPSQTPGRMNLFNFNDFNVMVDYAHNKDGFLELKKFMDNTDAAHKVAVVSATGDRRDEDIRMIGRLCAKMFDEIILRHDVDLRGRDGEELIRLIKEGIREEKPMEVKVITDEREAIRFAIAHAKKNSFIYVGADSVRNTIKYIEEERELKLQLQRDEKIASDLMD
jgi:cyanophycin synthetase